jgi:hypothetical protein
MLYTLDAIKLSARHRETSTWQHWQSQERDIHDPGGILTPNPSKRPQAHALGGAASGIGAALIYLLKKLRVTNFPVFDGWYFNTD